MTVEDLLKQLEHERKLEYTSVFRYGSKALDAMIDGDADDERFYERLHDESLEKIDRLRITIDEIKKRVS